MATTQHTLRRSQPPKKWSANFSLPFRHMDYGLLVAVLALSAVGLIMVYSSSVYVSLYFKQTTDYFFKRQLVATALGIAALLAIQFSDYRLIRYVSTPAMLVTLLLLFLVLVLGDTLQGSRRGLLDGSFQPSEIAKLVTICYVADWLSSKGERIREFGMGFLPFVIVIGIVGGLVVVQPDLSTCILIALIAFTMFFVAGARWSHFFGVALVGLAAVALLIGAFEHAAERWNDYWAMIQNPGDAEWHTMQAFYALARGGVVGQGLGNSFQKTAHLPLPHSDSILAVIGEELGLLGCVVVLGLLAVVGYRGYRLTMETQDSYGQLLALGITSWLVYQGLINAAVITGVVPFTGLPFPFVSYGGSSMATSLLGVGILLNIAQQNKRLKAGATRSRASAPRMRGKGKKRAADGFGRRDRRTYFAGAGHHR